MGSIKPCVVGFSGQAGSGKTTLSKALADVLKWPRASFGDFVRSVARHSGMDDRSRPVLQEIGERLIEQGWPHFCRDALITTSNWRPGNPVIVDGVRHVAAVFHLRELVKPLGFVLVHLSINEHLARERLLKRDGTHTCVGLEYDSRAIAEQDALLQLANLVVDGNESIEDIIDKVLSFLKTE